MGLAHPARHKPLLTRIGHESIMGYAIVVLLRIHHAPLAVQRVIRIVNNNVTALMMGSMQVLCSAEPSRCFAISAAIPIAWLLPIPGY